MSAPPPRPDPRFLTLFVDANFCHRTHAAGYGAWAKKAAFEKGLIFGGSLPHGITNAGEAELGGIALALRFLLEQKHLAELDRLMVQSDSLRSLQLISQVLPGVRIANHPDAAAVTKAQLQPSAMEGKALVAIKARASELDLLVRHVRGHKRGQQCGAKFGRRALLGGSAAMVCKMRDYHGQLGKLLTLLDRLATITLRNKNVGGARTYRRPVLGRIRRSPNGLLGDQPS